MIYSNQQAQLRIHNVTSNDSGHYSLLSENPQGCSVSSAYLAVESNDQVDHSMQQTTKEVISSYQETQETEYPSSESAKVLAPNFIRTSGDRDVTEGKMTRFRHDLKLLNLF